MVIIIIEYYHILNKWLINEKIYNLPSIHNASVASAIFCHWHAPDSETLGLKKVPLVITLNLRILNDVPVHSTQKYNLSDMTWIHHYF